MVRFLFKTLIAGILLIAPAAYGADINPLPKILPLSIEAVSLPELQQRVAKGDLVAQTELGSRYGRGAGIAPDLVKAISLIQSAAAKGEVTAQYFMGTATLTGSGVKQDYKQATEWFEKAAAQNHPGALYELGVITRDGKGGKPANPAAAVKLYMKAAEQGYIPAAYALGTAYQNGVGVPKDYEKAAHWYRRIVKTTPHSNASAALNILIQLGNVKRQATDPAASDDVKNAIELHTK